MPLRWSLLMILLVSLLLAPVVVQAQNSPAFDTVQVAIWPEYDRPDVLVIYYVSLSASVELPAEVSFLIPEAAKTPHAVAMKDVDGTLVTLDYTTATEGEWVRIRFTTPTPDIQLEYYDPRLTREANTRSFTYQWPGNAPVNSMAVQVQQPLTATEMQFNRSLGSPTQHSDGLTYYQTNIGSVPQGTQFGFTLTYQKDDDLLTASQQEVQPAAPVDSQTQGRLIFTERLPFIISGVLGLLLILGGLTWFWQSGRRKPTAPGRARHSANRRGETQEVENNTSSVYCSQCGKRAAPGDLFCRVCGTKLRN